MSVVVKSHLVKIGNSRGIRIPKVCLEQVGLKDEAVITVEAGRLVIRPARHPREGWAEQFKAMAEAGEDKLLDPETLTEWDKTEWEW
jgi:antitoxin MazE